MRITFDPEADAIYLTIAEFEKDNNGQSDVNDFGVIIDCDASGNPRGYEFLSVKFQGVILDTLPQDVVRAVTDFIESGALDSTEFVSQEVS
jgi:uncharacterized protein YuzE